MSSPERDEFGTEMLYLTTGRFVDMEKGGCPSNGQRYNVNYKFENYMMIGYFKTGKGQKIIEMKTDGPNHNRCNREHGVEEDEKFEENQLPNCMWYEPKILINGKVKLDGEWWHNDNRSGLRTDFKEDVEGGIKEQWIGYAVIVYWNQNGQRVIEQWCCKNPFDSNGKPTNNWKMNLQSTEKGDGSMFPKEYNGVTINFPRHVPTDFDPEEDPPRGLEAEVRMHKAKRCHQNPEGGGTDMKWCRVYEIIPPSPP